MKITELIDFHFFIQEAKLKYTLTKFCQTAKKVGKQVVEKAKTGVAFGAGYIKQTLSNNGIILPINSRLSRWLEQDWIKQNLAYNKGVFMGQLAGLTQAISEYVGASLLFTAGVAGTGVLNLFVGVGSGGTAAAAVPAMAVAEMAAVTAATAAIGAHASKVLQNNFNSRNYSSSKANGKYEDAPYHNKNQGNATKSKAPKNGQKALDNSYEIKNTSKRRISVSDGEFVVLDETSNGLFHGHVRKWEELTNEMKSILQKNGLVNKKGKILK
ncbi:hypothetical protein K7P65_002531 [Enterococcus faecalis]|nr:hypothetical protein [Enterococcus faecalis]EHU9677068.1 hypothetical protein [Enterococcus faecalis]EIA6405374.1 hypothetical protein [Enterococcus faecalis]EIA6414932.1 hypothetical protein [Enterococcus faecalis]EIA6916405.1 hypothetical protein [Enterococcus faecalis]